MRITGISGYGNYYNNYNNSNRKNNNVSFGRFKDANAESEMRKVYTAKKGYESMQPGLDYRFQTMKDCSFVDIYTDKDAGGKIRVKYDEKTLNGKNGENNFDFFMQFYDDLRTETSAASLYCDINALTKLLLPGKELEPPKNDEMSEIQLAQMQRDQDRIDWLTTF